jgi:hypothetical protein
MPIRGFCRSFGRAGEVPSFDKPPGDRKAEFHRPASHCSVCEFDSASGRQFLGHAQAQWQTVVRPDRVADNVGRKAVALERKRRLAPMFER